MPRKWHFNNLLEMIARPFRHEAENRKLQFDVEISPNLAGRSSIITDSKRLQQVLKNLLSNAFKFTADGGSEARGVPGGKRLECRPPYLEACAAGGSFEVTDTGIGIPPEKQRIIFEAISAGRRRHQPQVRAAPASGSRSAANLPISWAAKSNCAARSAWAASSRCICRSCTRAAPTRGRLSTPGMRRPAPRCRCAPRSARRSRFSTIAERSHTRRERGAHCRGRIRTMRAS